MAVQCTLTDQYYNFMQLLPSGLAKAESILHSIIWLAASEFSKLPK